MSTWGLYPWFVENGIWLVHPEDLDRFRLLNPYAKVFRQEAKREGYLVLHYGLEEYRVRPDLFEPVPAPSFSFKEWVTVPSLEHERAPHIGTIRDIYWDYKKRAPYFLVCIGGRMASRRYWENELVRLTP